MVVHALEASGTDVEAMVKSLEGWTFDGVKGKTTVRASDHALLQPMFQTKLVGSGTDMKAELVKALPAEDVTPPSVPFKE
jgi:branched-chain amino acid transport system substrate-binding protein